MIPNSPGVSVIMYRAGESRLNVWEGGREGPHQILYQITGQGRIMCWSFILVDAQELLFYFLNCVVLSCP